MALVLPDVADLSLPEAALAYGEAGIPVFPLAQRTKRPIFMGGFLQATTDREQLAEWWELHPNANIGAVPGLVGCIVPDIDTVEARRAWYERVVVETAATQTGGGVGIHPWYHSPRLAARSHWRLDEHGGPFQDDRLANLLFRASGGYIVVAPSIHPDTGQPYRLTAPGTAISDLPSDIEAALLTVSARDAGGGHPVSSTEAGKWLAEVTKPATSTGGEAALQECLQAITAAPKDTRNDTLMAAVANLLNAAYTWDINLDEARERVRQAYVPHVADTRRAAQANREVDHAFDYIATQRFWEGPPDPETRGLPIKATLTQAPSRGPVPVTRQDRLAARAAEIRASALDMDSLLSGDFPAIDWLIQDLIPRRRLTSIVAEAKSGKSLLLLDLAAAAATGTHALGPIKSTTRVLYLDYEMVPEDVSVRLMAMGYGQDEATVHLLRQNLTYLQIPPMDPLDTEEGGELLCQVVADLEAELVIVDTLAAAVAGAENDADTFRNARHFTWAPLKALGATVVRVDHLGKDKSRGARGSSMKRDDVDLQWELTKMANDQLLLKLAYSRLTGVADKITLERLSNPLRHVRVGTQTWATSGVSLARAIVAAGINIDAPERLTDQLRRANIEFDPAHLPEARRYIEAGMPPVGADMATPFSDPRATPASKQPPDKNRRRVAPPQVKPSDALEMS